MDILIWLQWTTMAIYAVMTVYLYPKINRTAGGKGTNSLVSIIVAVHNESNRLQNLLLHLSDQNYPKDKLQILIIDDQSTDHSVAIIKAYAAKHPYIVYHYSDNPDNWNSSKKAALQLGMEQARGEIILFTDADCSPPPGWVRAMLACFDHDTGLVAGFSPQQAGDGDIWNGFLLTDSMAAALVASGSIVRQCGITCTGRNLALRTQALQDIGGYKELPDTLSGDDDFLLQAITRHPDWRTTYAFTLASHVPASGPKNLPVFLQQKTRHLSSGVAYTIAQQTGYLFYHTFNLLLWFTLLLSPLYWPLVIAPVVKLFMDYFIMKRFSGILGAGLPISGFLLWEVLFPLYHILTAPRAFFGQPQWVKS